MTRFLLLLFVILIIVSCKPGIPNDIVQPEEMEKILFDIHVVDGYVSMVPTPDSAKKVSAPIYKGIFKKYGIDSAIHSKSMTYYYRHPDLLSKMYNNISKRLGKARDAETARQQKTVAHDAKTNEIKDTVTAKK